MAWESEADARDHARREAQARHSPSPGEPAGSCWPRRRGHRRGRRGLLLERPEGGRAGPGAAPRALGQRGAAPRTQRVDAQRTRRDEDSDRRIEAAFFSGFYPEGVTRVEPIRTCAHTPARTHTCARTGGEDMRGLSSRGTCALGRADANGDPAHVCWTQSGARAARGKPACSASRGGFAGGRRGRSRDRALRAPSALQRESAVAPPRASVLKRGRVTAAGRSPGARASPLLCVSRFGPLACPTSPPKRLLT